MDMLHFDRVKVFDRSDLLGRLERDLSIDPARTAVMTVEMTKRRLSLEAPLPPGTRERLLQKTETLLSAARARGMPTIHCLSSLRPIEARARAQTHFYQALSATGTSASPYGSVPSEVVPFQEGTFKPDLMVSQEPSDWIIKTKKSLSCFYATDLEWLLKAIKCDSLVLAGVSTNADLLSTAFEASCRGLSVFTIPECAASVYGEDLHTLALQQLGRCQGIVVGLDVMLQKINAA